MKTNGKETNAAPKVSEGNQQTTKATMETTQEEEQTRNAQEEARKQDTHDPKDLREEQHDPPHPQCKNTQENTQQDTPTEAKQKNGQPEPRPKHV